MDKSNNDSITVCNDTQKIKLENTLDKFLSDFEQSLKENDRELISTAEVKIGDKK